MSATQDVPPGVDPTRPSPARLYDYYLGGTYPGADRAVTFAGLWGAEDPVAADSEGSRGIYCGVARRP
jgi:hypothetical protein